MPVFTPQNIDFAVVALGSTNGNDVMSDSFTGVFYTNGDCSWRDLSPYLPQLHTPVSSVGIDCEAICVGMEGLGLVRFVGYSNVP